MAYEVGSFFGEEIQLASARARHLFTTSGWNTVIRAAGQATGVDYLGTYVPLRWNRGYARSQLFYAKAKGFPFFAKGDWARSADAGSNVQAVAKGGDVKVIVRVPVGHPTRPETAKSFREVPVREIAYLQRQFKAHLIRFIESTPNSQPTRPNGKIRAQVSEALAQSSRARARSIIVGERLRKSAPRF